MKSKTYQLTAAIVAIIAVASLVLGATVSGAVWYQWGEGRKEVPAASTCPILNMNYENVDLRTAGGNYANSASEAVLKIKPASNERIKLSSSELGWIETSEALENQLSTEIYLRTNGANTEVFFLEGDNIAYAGTINGGSFSYVENKIDCKIWKTTWSMD